MKRMKIGKVRDKNKFMCRMWERQEDEENERNSEMEEQMGGRLQDRGRSKFSGKERVNQKREEKEEQEGVGNLR